MPQPAKKTTAKATKTTKKATKPAAAKQPAHKSKKKPAAMQSFRLSKPDRPFLSLSLSVNTLYWLILCAMVLALGLWILNISIKVEKIYDQIDANNQQSTVIPKHTVKTKQP